jgi:hypothetical protein
MSAPVYVAFRHMARRPELEAYAREQAARLERFYGRIVACRVVVEPVDPGVLRASLEVTVPGERLVVSHTSEPPRMTTTATAPPAGVRWLHALHEAFRAADRSLQAYAARLRTNARQPRPDVAS